MKAPVGAPARPEVVHTLWTPPRTAAGGHLPSGDPALREYDLDVPPVKNRRRRFDDDEPVHRRRRGPAPVDLDGRSGVDLDGPPTGDRWSTWDGALHGPRPRPPWVITDHAAVDTELGVLKTGKEADVHLVERAVPSTDAPRAARRQALPQRRAPDVPPRRRLRRGPPGPPLPRDAGDGTRTAFGRDLLAGQWAAAEFAALARLWSDGVAVPYPVSLDRHRAAAGVRRLTRRVGRSAPGPAASRPGRAGRPVAPARRRAARAGPPGLTHGDLSAFNLLVHDGRLVRDRPAAGRRRGRQPAGAGVPRPGRAPASPTGSPRAGCPRQRTRRTRSSRSCARTCTFHGQASPAQPHTPDKVTPIGGEGGGPIGRASRMLDHERPAVSPALRAVRRSGRPCTTHQGVTCARARPE